MKSQLKALFVAIVIAQAFVVLGVTMEKDVLDTQNMIACKDCR